MNRRCHSFFAQKALIASGIAVAFASTGAYAVGVNDLYGDFSFTTTYANYTMLDASGATIGGTNDVAITWDGDAFTAISDYTGPGSYSNVSMASTTPFLGKAWTAHDIQVFTAGSYSFDTALGGGNPEAGIVNVSAGAGDVVMHMLFDWDGNYNIDIFTVFAPNSIFGSGVVRSASGVTYSGSNNCDAGVIKNCLWDGATNVSGHEPTTNQVWMVSSTDGNGDGIMGIPMAAGGPLEGYNANFNVTMEPIADVSDITLVSQAPVPAAAWLFGSGLLGLMGMARRKAV